MGKRRQPVLLAISTATGNNAGIGKALWDYGLRVLQKSQEDDRAFFITYSIDDDDDPWDEATWIKANPGWGVSVQPDAIRAIMRQARNNPAQEAAARTRHLNVWIGADEALFSFRAWGDRADRSLQLDDFAGRRCHMALDLGIEDRPCGARDRLSRIPRRCADLHRVQPLLHQRGRGDGSAQCVLSRVGRGG